MRKIMKIMLGKICAIFYKTKKGLSVRAKQISQTPCARQASEEPKKDKILVISRPLLQK